MNGCSLYIYLCLRDVEFDCEMDILLQPYACAKDLTMPGSLIFSRAEEC